MTLSFPPISRREQWRAIGAVTLAPLVTPVLYLLGWVTLGAVEGEVKGGIGLGLINAVVAVPFAYVAAAIVGIPGFVFLQRAGQFRPSLIAIIGGLAGAGAVAAARIQFALVTVETGALAGVLSAVVFWALWPPIWRNLPPNTRMDGDERSGVAET